MKLSSGKKIVGEVSTIMANRLRQTVQSIEGTPVEMERGKAVPVTEKEGLSTLRNILEMLPGSGFVTGVRKGGSEGGLDVLAELIGLTGGALGTVAGPAGTVGGYALGKAGTKAAAKAVENIPTRWYRGTDNPKELQNPAKWTFGKEGSLGGGGVYIAPNPEGASRYASEGWEGTRTEGGFVTPLDVIFDKPLIVDLNKDNGYYLEAKTLEALGVPAKKAENMAEKALENKGGFTTELKKRALDQGYDGIIVKKDGKITEAISYKPEKSIVSSITKKSKGGSVVERNPYNYQARAI